MGGDTRWMAAAIKMDGGGKIVMDGGSGNWQWRRDGKAIAMGNWTVAVQWMAQWVADNCHQCKSGAMGGNTRWTAAAITMDGSSKIAMDGSSGDGQRWHNGWQDSRVTVMGDGTAVAQWMAQWAAEDCRRHKSGAMGGVARWTAASIMMDGGSVIAMDGSSGNGQWQHNGWRDSK
jgi:hypothetical protein